MAPTRPSPPLGTGYFGTFGAKVKKNDVFLDFSENVDLDTPYSFFFFGFLSHCYGRLDAAGF